MRSSRRRRRKESRGNAPAVAIGAVVAVLLLGAGASALLWQPSFRVGTVTVDGTHRVPADAVRDRVERHIDGSWLFFAPKDAIPTIDGSVLERELKEEFPALASVRTKISGTTLALSVTERVAAGRWCPDGSGEGSEPACMAFDDRGFIFAPAEASDAALPAWYAMLLSEGLLIGALVAEGDAVASVLSLIEWLARSEVAVVKVVLSDEGETDLYLASGGYARYVRGEEDHVASVLPLLLSGELQGAPFEYVDLRFGRRVYVKRQGL